MPSVVMLSVAAPLNWSLLETLILQIAVPTKFEKNVAMVKNIP
jgi:hypothetical protein